MSKQSLKAIIAALIITMCISKPATVNAQIPLTESDLNKKISTLINQMTLEEKVKMLHGNSSFTSAGVPRLVSPNW